MMSVYMIRQEVEAVAQVYQGEAGAPRRSKIEAEVILQKNQCAVRNSSASFISSLVFNDIAVTTRHRM